MNRSDNINEIAAALAKAQGAMRHAKKDEANPFYKSKYADLASVVEAIKEPLASNGLSYAQVLDVGEDGVYVETLLMHASGQWISGRLKMPVAKPNDPQALGSASTYCRRFALQSIVGVPSADDDGEGAMAGVTRTNPKGVPLGKGAISPADGVEERVSVERRIAVQAYVEAAREHLGAGFPERALAELSQLTDADERVYANTFFDSKDRAAMKKAKSAELPERPF